MSAFGGKADMAAKLLTKDEARRIKSLAPVVEQGTLTRIKV
jgi:hypothetical protein